MKGSNFKSFYSQVKTLENCFEHQMPHQKWTTCFSSCFAINKHLSVTKIISITVLIYIYIYLCKSIHDASKIKYIQLY